MNTIQKRLRFLSAFCVLCLLAGCIEPNTNQTIPTYSDKDSKVSIADDVNGDTSVFPKNQALLNLQELLNATDVKLALAKAADEGNTPMLEYWQRELIKAANEVNLDEDELSLITGPQGLKYLEFQGMKTNYQKAFEQAFLNFQDVDAVYKAYPVFENLHARSRTLVIERDKLIEQVTEELKASDFEGDAQQEARMQWQNYMVNELSKDTNKPLQP